MKLWQAILIGCDKRAQAFKNFFTLEGDQCKSCAIGAAMEGAGFPIMFKNSVPSGFWQKFPSFIKGVSKNSLYCDCPIYECRSKNTPIAIIVHLNDEHRWTREKIALEFVKPIEDTYEETVI